MEGLSTIDQQDLKAALEAMLLVSTDPVAPSTLASALDRPPAEVQEALKELAEEYRATGRGFQLREVAGGWRMYTHPAFHDLVEAYVQSWDTHRLTNAALETLAVIAYRQPATREGVKAIRGVSSDSAISSLVDKGLVKEMGKREGGAILYGTTQAFLEKFGLRSPRDLPPLEDFAPDEETRRLIKERLTGQRPQADPAEDEDGEDMFEDYPEKETGDDR